MNGISDETKIDRLVVNLNDIFISKKYNYSIISNYIREIINYNGELENNKVERIIYLGRKKRKIYVPTKEYKEFCKKFLFILNKLNININRVNCKSTKSIINIINLNLKFIKKKTIKISEIDSFIRSCKDSVKDNLTIKFDISKAFESTNLELVKYSLFSDQKIINSRQLEFYILLFSKLKYLFIDNKLPQGFPTSSFLFNLVQNNIETRFNSFILHNINNNIYNKEYKHCFSCHQNYDDKQIINGITYIRYVDDFYVKVIVNNITNCKNHYNFILYNIKRFYRAFGYTVNNKKTKIYPNNLLPSKFIGLSLQGKHVLTKKVRDKIKGLQHKYNNIDLYYNTEQSKKEFKLYYNAYLSHYAKLYFRDKLDIRIKQ